MLMEKLKDIIRTHACLRIAAQTIRGKSGYLRKKGSQLPVSDPFILLTQKLMIELKNILECKVRP